MGTELITSEQLGQIANPKTTTEDAKDGFKGATNLMNEINKGLSTVMQIVNKYQSAKAMMNPEQEQGVNVNAKIEKGVNSQIAKMPQPSQPRLEIHAGNGAKYLKEKIAAFIQDDTTGKELKEQLNEMPEDLLANTVRDFIRQHIEIK